MLSIFFSVFLDFITIYRNISVKKATLCYLVLSWSQLGKENNQESDLHLHCNSCEKRYKSDHGFRDFAQNARK